MCIAQCSQRLSSTVKFNVALSILHPVRMLILQTSRNLSRLFLLIPGMAQVVHLRLQKWGILGGVMTEAQWIDLTTVNIIWIVIYIC